MKKFLVAIMLLLKFGTSANEVPKVVVEDSKIQVSISGQSYEYVCTSLCADARLTEAKWNSDRSRFYILLSPTVPDEYFFRVAFFDLAKREFGTFSHEGNTGALNAHNDLGVINYFPNFGENENSKEYKAFKKNGGLVKVEVVDMKNLKRHVIAQKKAFPFYPFFDTAGFLNYSNPKGKKGSLVKISPDELRSKF